jgi:hypothetical protein
MEKENTSVSTEAIPIFAFISSIWSKHTSSQACQSPMANQPWLKNARTLRSVLLLISHKALCGQNRICPHMLPVRDMSFRLVCGHIPR